MVDALIHLPGDLVALLPALLPREEVVDHSSTRPYGLLIALYGMGRFFGPAVLWAGIKARREEGIGIARLATSGPLTLAGLYALFSGDLGYIALTLGPFFLWTAWHAWLSTENRLPWLAHLKVGLAFAPYLFFAPPSWACAA